MRVSIQIVLFLIFLNAGAAAIQAAGVTQDLGIQPNPGENEQVAQATDQNEFDTSQGSGDNLFGLYNSLAGVLETIFLALNPAAEMMINVGVPKWIVNWLGGGVELYAILDMIAFLRNGGVTS